jgi:hypothetical protein
MSERSRQKEMVQQQLISLLEYTAEACTNLSLRLKRGNLCNLGGDIQNTWQVFYKLGELNILAADYLFEDKNKDSLSESLLPESWKK